MSISKQKLHSSYVLSEESSYTEIGMTVECSNQSKSNYRLRGRNYVHNMEENNLGAKDIKKKREISLQLNVCFQIRNNLL